MAYVLYIRILPARLTTLDLLLDTVLNSWSSPQQNCKNKVCCDHELRYMQFDKIKNQTN